MTRRTVAYVTGTRADFGLAERMLHRIHDHPRLALRLIVTGMHRVATFGMTETLVEQSGLPIGARVDMLLAGDGRRDMAIGVGVGIIGMTQAIESLAPDVVLLLGDRGEMLAAALAAIHLGVPVAHCHGGEISGTVDEAVRHAVSKLSHLHFVATETSAARLRRMGERTECVFVTGAPGLDDLVGRPIRSRAAISAEFDLEAAEPWALVIYHPDTQSGDPGAEVDEVLAGLESYVGQLLVFEPNSDAGRSMIVDRLDKLRQRPRTTVLRHVPRQGYASLLAHAQVMVGNSSSGIIEAPSLGVPVVNVGRRQDLRERGDNVIDVPAERAQVAEAVSRACGDRAFLDLVGQRRNPYGDGRAGERIATLLDAVVLDEVLLQKRFAD